MSAVGEVLFLREEDDLEEVDDTALIRAYEKTVGLLYDKVSEAEQQGKAENELRRRKSNHAANKGDRDDQSPSGSRRKQGSRGGRKHKKKWHNNDACLAQYDGDGEWYEAVIVNLRPNSCLVRYVDYDEEAVVKLSQIKRQDSLASGSRSPVNSDAGNEHAVNYGEGGPDEHENSYFAHPWGSVGLPNGLKSTAIPHLPPPPPPQDLQDPNDSEALASMLLAWYMSGYHTGYYQARKDAKRHCSNCGCDNSNA